jgi:hypothetical protein
MPGLDREAIYAALATRLATVSSLTGGVSRRLPPSGQVGPAEQPRAFLAVEKETPSYRPNLPLVWTLNATLLIYARTDDAAQAPGTVLANVVRDIETALQFVPGVDQAHGFGQQGTVTNLGGLCAHCAIGSVEYGEGIADGQGIALVPITIVAEVR